jgi:hypothetical protein
VPDSYLRTHDAAQPLLDLEEFRYQGNISKRSCQLAAGRFVGELMPIFSVLQVTSALACCAREETARLFQTIVMFFSFAV